MSSDTAQSPARSLRYSPGLRYIFIHIEYERATDRPSIGMYFPGHDKIEKFRVEELECAEHHKVGWAEGGGDDKPYDGFIFKDPDDGEEWHNQFPAASYGQLNDSADWLLSPVNHRQYEDTKDFMYHLTDVRQYLRGLLRAIRDFKDPESRYYSPAYLVHFQEHIEQVKREVLEQTGYEIRITLPEAEPGKFQRERIEVVKANN